MIVSRRGRARAVMFLAAFGALAAGCSVKRVASRDPGTSAPPAPYDFQGEAKSPPPPAVPAEPAGQASPGLDMEQPADLGAPAVAVQDLPASPPPSVPPGSGEMHYRVQVFASPDAAAAERVRAELEARFGPPATVTYQAPYYKVRVGDCPTNDACRDLQERLRSAGYDTVWIVPDAAR